MFQLGAKLYGQVLAGKKWNYERQDVESFAAHKTVWAYL